MVLELVWLKESSTRLKDFSEVFIAAEEILKLIMISVEVLLLERELSLILVEFLLVLSLEESILLIQCCRVLLHVGKLNLCLCL